ncbi:hypothetical protein AYO44_13165 [Planctomycetaceae bacterium SCGC AG-212-F19]|nr:hypothetical protein AYO44_13165 [Planctomycetaceae bacterium SCGC AG-212-F19]
MLGFILHYGGADSALARLPAANNILEDLDGATDGYDPAVSDLIYFLRCNNRQLDAQSLEGPYQSGNLFRVHSVLARIRNSPAKDLPPVKRKELGKLLHRTIGRALEADTAARNQARIRQEAIRNAELCLDGANPTGDGPFPPDGFRWSGKQVTGLSIPQWKLLDALCVSGRLRDAVPLNEVIRQVYGIDKYKQRALGELRRRTENKLTENDIPLAFDLTNQTLRLLPIRSHAKSTPA